MSNETLLPRVAPRRLAGMFSRTLPTPSDLPKRLDYESMPQFAFNAKVKNRRQRAAERRLTNG